MWILIGSYSKIYYSAVVFGSCLLAFYRYTLYLLWASHHSVRFCIPNIFRCSSRETCSRSCQPHIVKLQKPFQFSDPHDLRHLCSRSTESRQNLTVITDVSLLMRHLSNNRMQQHRISTEIRHLIWLFRLHLLWISSILLFIHIYIYIYTRAEIVCACASVYRYLSFVNLRDNVYSTFVCCCCVLVYTRDTPEETTRS